MGFWLEYIDGGGMRHTIQYDGADKLWIGRRLGCSIHSFDDHLSREHCWVEIDQESGACVLQDNASTDGTFINGSPIVTHVLEHGDVIECASLLVTFWARPRGAIDTDELDQLSARLDEPQGRAQRLQAERDATLEARRSGEGELQAELDALRSAHQDMESHLGARLNESEDARERLTEDLESHRVREAKLNAQLDWLEKRVYELEHTPTTDAEADEALRQALRAAEERAERADEESHRFSDELDEARETLSRVRRQLDQANHKLERQRGEADESASERDAFWGELQEARKTIEDLRGIIDNQESMIDTLREAARERESVIQKLRNG